MGWSGGLTEWVENGIAHISVVFSWLLQRAYARCVWYSQLGLPVRVGGPPVSISGEMFADVAEVGGEIADAVSRHNPDATFTSRGCVRSCPFCIVPKSEGPLVELADWPVRPIICDNNLLATSRVHFDRVIDRLRPIANVDFNQGLDARLLTMYHARRLRELDTKVIRLAWDHIALEETFLSAWQRLLDSGFPPHHIQSYVLIGFKDTPDDARYRLETIRHLGGRPNPMRYQPLDAIRKNGYMAPGWSDGELKAYTRYWSRQNWLSKVPFDEYMERTAGIVHHVPHNE